MRADPPCPDCGHEKNWHMNLVGCSVPLGTDTMAGGMVLREVLAGPEGPIMRPGKVRCLCEWRFGRSST